MNINKSYDVVIFDIDDTLVNPNYTDKQRFDLIFGKNNINKKDEEKIKTNLYKFLFDFEDKFQNTYLNEDIIIENFVNNCEFINSYNLDGKKIFNDIMESTVEIVEPIKESKEVLEYLKDKGYTILALTNWLYNVQSEKLKKVGLFDYFDEILCIDENYLKPSKLAFERILNKYESSRCLMIGDSYKCDVQGAKNASIDSVWYNKKLNKQENSNPDYEIYNLNELKNIL